MGLPRTRRRAIWSVKVILWVLLRIYTIEKRVQRVQRGKRRGQGPLSNSDAAVRFGPVQRTLCLNLGPDLWFGSSRLLNLGLDLEGPVRKVRFG